MRWIKALFMGIGLAALVWLLGVASPASGQGGFMLYVDPLVSDVPVGTDMILDLIVEEGVDLNAFDVTMTYDPSILTLVNWDYGDYFSNLASMSVVNQPGTLRVAATQVATSPVSGDGALLNLNFTAKADGFSSIDITQAEFADSTGNKVEPGVINGQVYVNLGPTYTPSVTMTPTGTIVPTATQMPTGVLIPTATVTQTPPIILTPTRTQRVVMPTQVVQTATARVTYSGLGTAYPGGGANYPQDPESEAALLTETALGLAMPSLEPGSLEEVVPSAQAESVDETRDRWDGEPLVEEELKATPTAGRGSRALDTALWVVLIASGAALVAMLILLIVRRKRRDKDLLL